VIGVTDAEVAEWAKQGKLIRTGDGTETDARTLAAQIGLAKAMREYDLRRIITFHRSIRRASRFVDSDRNDSLPAVVNALPPSARPPGILWTRHISGETPAGKRIATLRALAELPENTRGLISNCACLGEGVDVPSLDGIAFIDPKGSVVEIIQAVGRVIRLSRDKAIGTIVIPVFVDQSTDAAHALTHSSFDPVWQVLKALRAHDQRLADELDSLRTADGKGIGGSDRLRLPHNVVIEARAVLLPRFAEAFYVRVVENTTQPATQKDLLLDLVRTHIVVRSRDFERAGVSRVAVQRALASGTIVQQARGVYSLPNIVADRTQQIAFVALKTPRAIVCLLTAAELHGMANESSERIWVMVDKSAHKPVDSDGRMAIVRASGAALTKGVVQFVRGKQQFQVTSPAKTVADFFRYRATVGEDAAITILKECLRLKKATADEILEMAEVDRVARMVQPYLKALA